VVAAWGAYSDGKVANRDVREALEPAAAGALPVVAAWGAYSDGKVANRDVREALESLQPQVRCLWWQRGEHTAMAKLRIVTLGRHWSLQPQVRCLWWQRGIQRWQSCES
jgi:hypothetical protein